MSPRSSSSKQSLASTPPNNSSADETLQNEETFIAPEHVKKAYVWRSPYAIFSGFILGIHSVYAVGIFALLMTKKSYDHLSVPWTWESVVFHLATAITFGLQLNRRISALTRLLSTISAVISILCTLHITIHVIDFYLSMDIKYLCGFLLATLAQWTCLFIILLVQWKPSLARFFVRPRLKDD